MSTWTSNLVFLKRRATAIFLVSSLALSACAIDAGGGGGGGFSILRRAPQSIRVLDRQVAIAGPDGFCIDKTSSRDVETGAFVLLGNCAAISQNPRDDQPRVPAVLTASVSTDAGARADDAEALDRLESFFSTNAGRKALSRSAKADTVSIHRVTRVDGALLLFVGDSSKNGLGSIAQDYWRGLFDVNGHLVTVTVSAFASRPFGEDVGLDLISGFVKRIRAVNPDRTGGGGALIALFNRLP